MIKIQIDYILYQEFWKNKFKLNFLVYTTPKRLFNLFVEAVAKVIIID